ncbi:FAD dependent oxidoreductase [Rhodopseudomonas palustris HaA2]|uniref:FAD dependent oxidoreductase n=1 Tax=Rhodopseudomonas palustris (strain HaA2) TaxID=316058 RepID=Q2J402_RHOP2|nr:NAD(P)/FAD-dependent oxidoreductase [Rhodopseudomonas palustris]ABD04808.1 FAD dependent oxidoreductase [Rhodopseudomonas palustris HaA2]
MKTFLTVKLVLVPFALFWALLAMGHVDWAIGAGLVLALIGNAWRAWRRELFVLEVGGLVLFLGLGGLLLVVPDLAAPTALWLSFAGLSAISIASLVVRRPWTSDYARAAYPDNAATPQFFVINAAITALWAVLFAAIAACRYAGAPGGVIAALVIGGALISIFGPRLAIRFVLQRLAASGETYRWPAPSFARDNAADCDVAVIGAGIGGLTAAALLADAGLKVKVFDQHVVAGGYCHTYLRKAHHLNKPVLYRFDAGPHDFSGVQPGGPFATLLLRLGVADRITWERVTQSFHTARGAIDVPPDWRDYVRVLGERFPDSAAGIKSLFEEIKAIFDDMFSTAASRGGVPGPPSTIDELLAFPRAHPHAYKWMNRPFAELVAAHVRDPAVVAVIDGLAGYIGDGSEPPSCARMVPIFGYYFHGGYYPRGGSGVVADALVEAIEARDGEVRLKTAVKQIIVENGSAAGVVLADGERVRARAVVSNADFKRTLLELVPAAALPRGVRDDLAAAAPANSCFSVHLGVDFVPDLGPSTHLHAPMPLGIAMMSKCDPTAAPPGHAILSLIALVPHDEAKSWFPQESGGNDWKEWRRSEDYLRRKEEFGDRMIAAAETAIPGLSQHIVYRTDASPVTYARYDWASFGAIYGMSTAGQLKGSKTALRHLVIAGGGNIGAGVEAVVISGANAAEALVPGLLARAGSEATASISLLTPKSHAPDKADREAVRC